MQAAFVLEQAAAWAAERPDDRITILAPHDFGAARSESVGGIEIRRFRYFAPGRMQRLAYPAILPNLKRNPLLLAQVPPFLLAEFFAARRLVRERNIDLVYAHWVMPQGLVAWQLHRFTGTPFVIQNHSSDVDVFARLGRPGRALAKKVIGAAAAMFCVNRQQKDRALSLFRASERKSVEDKITVLPMGVRLPPENGPAPGGGYAYQFGTISRLSRKKRLDLLIEAARRLGRADVRIAIAGDGEERARLAALAEGSGVTFAGFLAGPAKRAFFDSTQFFVFPAVAAGGDVEGLPVALLEALCSGKPVVASRDTNVEMLPEWELIKDDVAFVEDPRDVAALTAAMTRLLDLSPSEVEARSRHLRSIIGRYRWERLIREYLEAIDSALEPLAQV
jgi:glycosyltransferase involved in cell wall biosynthesis